MQSRKSKRNDHASRLIKIANDATLYYAQSWARLYITLIIWDPSRVTENPFATLRVVQGGPR